MSNTFTFTPIVGSESAYCDFAKALYEDCFPAEERRMSDEWIALTASDTRFSIQVLCQGTTPVGFIGYWQFEGFNYVEHLAVVTSARKHGLGRVLLSKAAQRNIVLEVEPPCDAITRGRIKFYHNVGFKMARKIDYHQPPYPNTGNSNWLELKLMTTNIAWLYANRKDVIKQIYKYVYHQPIND